MNQLPLTTIEQAKQLRSLGFDWPTTGYFGRLFLTIDIGGGDWQPYEFKINNWNSSEHTLSRPTIPHALMWLREVKELHGCVSKQVNDPFPYHVRVLNGDDFEGAGAYSTYSLAEYSLLNHILKIITEQAK